MTVPVMSSMRSSSGANIGISFVFASMGSWAATVPSSARAQQHRAPAASGGGFLDCLAVHVQAAVPQPALGAAPGGDPGAQCLVQVIAGGGQRPGDGGAVRPARVPTPAGLRA